MKKSLIIEFPQEIKIAPNSCSLFVRRPIIESNRTNYTYWNAHSCGELVEPKKQVVSNLTDGFLSMKAQSRLKSKIKYMFWLSDCFQITKKKIELKANNKISFVTLTLSYDQFHSDTYIKEKMLNQLITELKQRYLNFLYIWRAEKQKNGNIHFHFLINRFIPWHIIRQIWNRIQLKEGYIRGYQQKFRGIWFEEYVKGIRNFNINKLAQYKKAWLKGTAEDWTDPNSIDVVCIKSVKNVYAYISKYIAKNKPPTEDEITANPDEGKIEGRIYYCCKELNSINPESHFLDSAIIADLDIIKDTAHDKIFDTDYFTIIRLSIEQLFNMGCFHLFKLFILSTKQLT